ncbi:S-adenosyl-L-methionine-dependent methyltransferase [Piptocephalis cylindrospora]|uniref:S-adenosyl-L-methionine-dependent methyltransferase n=1 Tax=Piptocephalis cylindrospora TaxID=1907219 RepID=A0A4P9Y206_9FUNG|nr:S-adenosyl-L-methionine-dependent methyltransferase [Piptocephalis cylindrospora]|eukprot:RKP12704.1 S-adenosyl-L-methionine-dependent methyltransferase [Piptocephalis cylindrospora]
MTNPQYPHHYSVTSSHGSQDNSSTSQSSKHNKSSSISNPSSSQSPTNSGLDVETVASDAVSYVSSTASEFDYVIQDGRALLVGSNSLLPQDLEEFDRADMSHGVLKYLCRTNHVAPLPWNTHRIFEMGCGSGLWCKEMALEFPRAEIIGCDMTEAGFRDPEEMPPNVILEYGNILEGLKYMDEEFDYTHQRAIWAIPTKDWPRTLDTLYRITAPMGTCEVAEAIGMCYPPDHPVCAKINRWVIEAHAYRGIDLRDGARIASMMDEAGFVHVREVNVNIPFGEWKGIPGRVMSRSWLRFLNGVRTSPKGREMPETEFRQMLADLEAEMSNPYGLKIYCPMYFVFGRRPAPGWR